MNQNIIVTGASRGIGKAIVEVFAKNGDNVWACIRREDEDYLKWIEHLSQENDVWIKAVHMELTDIKSIKDGFKSIMSEKKNIDVLVNCAGIGHMNLFQLTSLEQIRQIYEVNLFALMALCQLGIRAMSRQKSGKIINIASTAGEETYVGNSIYGSSKAAVIAFSKSLAAETAPLGIQVNCVAPGLTETEMSAVFEGKDATLPMERSALGRKLDPAEIADAIVGLTSKAMRMVNGHVLVVNGGAK